MRSSWFLKVAGAAVVALAMLAAAPAAQAQGTIQFDDALVDGGTLAYDGEGGALVGANVLFDLITGSGTPLNSGVSLDCLGCELDFTTGPNTLEGSSANGSLYTWSGGGSFTITGTAQQQGGGAVVASGTLVTGFWTGTVVGNVGGGIQISGSGTDVKHVDLAAFYGLTTGSWIYSNTEIDSDVNFAANNGFAAPDVNNADFNNTNIPTTVPEPASLMLLGAGLFGFAAAARRRK